MRLALCQVASTPEKAVNLSGIIARAEEAAARGAELIVFPEYAMHHIRSMGAEFIAQAEPLDGPFVSALVELADRLGVQIVAGMSERIPGAELVYNSLVQVSASGLERVYHKAHLYDAFGFKESEFMRPGELEGPVTCEVGGVRVGMLTCYDLRFPEAAREHADAGVELLLYPAAWVPGERKVDHWRTLLRARAIENTLFVAGVGLVAGSGVGHSLVADPAGTVLGELGDDPETLLLDIDPALVAASRRENPSLANRRFTVSGTA